MSQSRIESNPRYAWFQCMYQHAAKFDFLQSYGIMCTSLNMYVLRKGEGGER